MLSKVGVVLALGLAYLGDDIGLAQESKTAPAAKVVSADAMQPIGVRGPSRFDHAPTKSILNQPAKMEFVESPLNDVCAYLSAYHKKWISFDKNAVAERRDVPITAKIDGAPLGVALQEVLQPHGLAYLESDLDIRITSQKEADAVDQIVIYPVADLIDRDSTGGNLDQVIKTIMAAAPQLAPDEVDGKIGKHRIQGFPPSKAIVVTANARVQQSVNGLLAGLRTARQQQAVKPAVARESKTKAAATAVSAPSAAQPIGVKGQSRFDHAPARSILDEPTKLEFIETPLNDACAYLQDIHRKWFSFDKTALAEKHNALVTAKISGVPLRVALQEVLQPHGLAYLESDFDIRITSQKEAEAVDQIVIYPVGDLIDRSAKDGGLDHLIQTVTAAVHQLTPDEADGKSGKSRVQGFRPSEAIIVTANARVQQSVVGLLTGLQKARDQQGTKPRAPRGK